MTKREMIVAMLEGKTLETVYKEEAYFWPDAPENKSPFRYVADGNDEPMEVWSHDWRIREEPVVLPMTRDEVLGFIAHAPGIVVRFKKSRWESASTWCWKEDESDIPVSEWATITPDGKIGEPHAFDSNAWATYKREVGE